MQVEFIAKGVGPANYIGEGWAGLMVFPIPDLVTGKRLRRAEARADRLEERIWALMDAASVAITAAEVSNEAIRRIPVVEDDDDVSEGVS